ncbi:MAG TPA: CBS domain-containing protein [Nitrososphaerales archaeon]|nr:CBS domain-containing protein [Nitrososphaerales archaeon]
MSLREDLDKPVSKFMSVSFAKIGADETVAGAAKAMQKAGTTEAIVVKGGAPVGIITERDIVYKVVAAGSHPSTVTVADVMSSPVETIDGDSKVMDAISKMSKMGLRRLGVTSKGKLVGMVTQKAMVSGTVHQGVALPELAPPDKVRCPYCEAVMKDGSELSRHIDHVHLGLGLLEGDKGQW